MIDLELGVTDKMPMIEENTSGMQKDIISYFK
jgi:hypothetical protein